VGDPYERSMHKVQTTRFPRMRIVCPSRLQPFEANSLISQVAAGKGVARYNGWAVASAIDAVDGSSTGT
jgi:hypothetical protein